MNRISFAFLLAALFLTTTLVSANNKNDGFLTLLQTTEEIWNHHIAAFTHHDTTELLSDYSDDSFMIVNNIVITGKDKIKPLFEQLFVLFGNGKQIILGTTVRDNIIFITWTFQPNNDPNTYFGTDSFFLNNGKIQAQTIASTLYDNYPVKV